MVWCTDLGHLSIWFREGRMDVWSHLHAFVPLHKLNGSSFVLSDRRIPRKYMSVKSCQTLTVKKFSILFTDIFGEAKWIWPSIS